MPAIVEKGGRIGVFCGARTGVRSAYLEFAKDFGTALARRDLGLVYGGGGVGIMGAVADAVLAAGGNVTGVIPVILHEKVRPDKARGKTYVVRSMHQRKALMYRLSSGFAVLPGGFGTLDELMEVATWTKLGIIEKPIVVVNCEGFFDLMLDIIDHIVKEGFISDDERGLIRVANDLDEAFDLLGVTTRQAILST
jgi:uncharacterized protein (TIGR00730 family)